MSMEISSQRTFIIAILVYRILSKQGTKGFAVKACNLLFKRIVKVVFSDTLKSSIKSENEYST